MSYDTGAIRELLKATFDDQELMIFCYDHFRPVYDKFASEMNRLWKIQLLIDYCERYDQFDNLLTQVRGINPKQYTKFISSIKVPPQASKVNISGSKSQIELILRGDAANFTPELQLAVVGILASVLDIPRAQINVLQVHDGSIILQLEMPTEAANQLIALYQANNPIIEDLGIRQVRIIGSRGGEDLASIVEEIASITEQENNAPYPESKPSTSLPSSQASRIPPSVITEMGKWWAKRGYTANPFEWSNAAFVERDNLLELFLLWHIDPQGPEKSQGLGITPTLDDVKSLSTGEPVLIYAATGSGKTFYRRWAAQQIAEEYGSLGSSLEIPGLEEYIQKEHLRSSDLARGIYKSICEKFSIQTSSLRTTNIASIFKKCEDIIRESIPDASKPRLLYIFIDGIDQLFDEQPTRAEYNSQTLKALIEFCIAAAKRDRGPLALRMFVPLQLQHSIQEGLGNRWRRRTREYTISWRPGHCRDIIERRLDSRWHQGPNTGIIHISRLLAEDALDEFDKWLVQQAGISPRCVIDVLNHLGKYAYSQGVTAGELIKAESWKFFLGSSDIQIPCSPDVSYPLIVTTQVLAPVEPKPPLSLDPLSSGPDTRSNNVLIVTVTKVEAQAVLTVFSQAAGENWTRLRIGNKTYYHLGVHGGVPVSMVQSEMGTATPGGALVTVHQAIHDLRPQAVIMCGIAFGLRPNKQQIGDILVARQLMYYEPQKVDLRRGQMPRGDRTTAAERLLDRFRSGDNDWRGAPTHFGLVLSGEKLVNDPKFREWLLQTEPEAIGGEMEGAGLYAAARDAKVDWILVKGICDWADGEKDDSAHSQAASNAAQFVLYVLQLGGWGGSE